MQEPDNRGKVKDVVPGQGQPEDVEHRRGEVQPQARL